MIRPAKQTDAQALGAVYCQGWQQGYAGLMPQFFLDALTPANCAPKPDHIAPDRRFVAEVNGEVVGTVTFGKGRDSGSEGFAEIYALYVLPEHWRTGQGSALVRSVVDAVKAQGFSGLYLWTLGDNTRARAFYEHLGMTLTGQEREFEIAGSYLPEVKYQLKW
jgi:GNAT superfamily N-acetyltransferase